jgi:hypothetical protein
VPVLPRHRLEPRGPGLEQRLALGVDRPRFSVRITNGRTRSLLTLTFIGEGFSVEQLHQAA